MLRKTLRNDIKSNNRHFDVVLLKNLIYIGYNLSYSIIISRASIKKYEFCKCTLIIKIH